MKIIITNMTGFRNKGCEGMTKVIIEKITEYIPNAEFIVFTNDPDYDKAYIESVGQVTFIKTPAYQKSRLKRSIKLLFEMDSALKHIWDKAECVISTGGDVFSSEYSGLERHLSYLEPARKYRLPVFLLGHSVGPFIKQEELQLFKQKIPSFCFIAAREKSSFDYLKKIGVCNANLHLTADPAFLLKPCNKETTESLLKYYRIPEGKKLIGLCVSQNIARYSNISYEEHFQTMLEFIRYLLEEQNTHIVMIPHVREQAFFNNDLIICTQLSRALAFKDRISVLSLEHTCEELKGIICKCEMLITERMHAGIAAISHGVPILAIGYSIKAEGIMGDFLPDDDLNKCLLPIKGLSLLNLQNSYGYISNNRDRLSKQLISCLQAVISRAEGNFTILRDYFKI